MEIRWKLKIIVLLSIYIYQFADGDDKNANQQYNTKLNLSNNNFSELINITKTPKRNDNLQKINNQYIDDDNLISNVRVHSRKKRLIWITDDGRLALPPGTALSITPSITLPLVRYPPEGFLANISISFPVTIDFDKLGLTDNQNPLGDLPPIFARSFGRSAGRMLGNYVSNYLNYRNKRDTLEQNTPKIQNYKFNVEKDDLVIPKLPDQYKHIFHGGERALLYGAVEDLLSTFGVDGKACLLRTICEVHSRSLEHFGFIGEATKLFLTASKSPFSDYIKEYVEAERIGEGKEGPGECFPYYKDCPRSIFKENEKNKYSETSEDLPTKNIKENDDAISDTLKPIQNILSM